MDRREDEAAAGDVVVPAPADLPEALTPLAFAIPGQPVAESVDRWSAPRDPGEANGGEPGAAPDPEAAGGPS